MPASLSPANDLDQSFVTLLDAATINGTPERYYFNRSNWLYHTVQVINADDAAACTVQLYESLDGIHWIALDTPFSISDTLHLDPAVYRFLKAVVTAGTANKAVTVKLFSGYRLAQ